VASRRAEQGNSTKLHETAPKHHPATTHHPPIPTKSSLRIDPPPTNPNKIVITNRPTTHQSQQNHHYEPTLGLKTHNNYQRQLPTNTQKQKLIYNKTTTQVAGRRFKH
jgi:hypothetical protein